MNPTPAISLVICAFNREKYVADAIKSVLNQTRRDFELVVWDDASTDNTLRVAQKTAGTDPRVRVIAGERNLGQPLAINAAAKLISSPYFGWIDSDDLLAESALKETAGVLDANPQVGVVYTDYITIDESATVIGPGKRCNIPYSKDRLLVDFMTFHFRLMRRSLFDAAGQCDPAMRLAEDYDLCLKLSEITDFHRVARPLYYYRVHGESLSHQRSVEQIEVSAQAIRNALLRRGMADKHELNVHISATYQLRRKTGK